MNSKYLSTLNGLIENDHLYTVDIDSWLFLDYNTNNGECKLLADIRRTGECYPLCWVKTIIHNQNEFYIVFRNYKGIVSVDTTGTTAYYDLVRGFSEDKIFFYTDACLIDGLVYMFPGTIGGTITVFSTQKHCFIEDISMLGLFDKDMSLYRNNNIYSYIFDNRKRKVYFCINDTNILCELDIDKMQICTIYGDNADFSLVAGSIEKQILLEKEGFHLFSYFPQEGIIECLGNFTQDKNEKEKRYQIVLYANNEIIALTSEMKRMEVIRDKQVKFCIDISDYFTFDSSKRKSNRKFSIALLDSKYIYFLPLTVNEMLRFDFEKFKMDTISLKIPEKYLLMHSLRQNCFISETQEFSLHEYINNNLETMII